MVDISVRLQVAGDAEVVLNMPTTQAVRLIEALMHNVAEAMAAQGRGGLPGQQRGLQMQPSAPQQPPGTIGWGDTQLRGDPPPSESIRRSLG